MDDGVEALVDGAPGRGLHGQRLCAERKLRVLLLVLLLPPPMHSTNACAPVLPMEFEPRYNRCSDVFSFRERASFFAPESLALFL